MRSCVHTGPFRLGRWSRPIGVVACIWILVSTVGFSLPIFYPLQPLTYNYTPVLLAFVLLASLASWWCPGIGGVHWFTG